MMNHTYKKGKLVSSKENNSKKIEHQCLVSDAYREIGETGTKEMKLNSS